MLLWISCFGFQLYGAPINSTLEKRAETACPHVKMILVPCPEKPNCVSSQVATISNSIEPFRFKKSNDSIFAMLKNVILNMPNTAIIQSTDHYLHAEFRTRWLKFTDDFEAVLCETENLIHIRSASRVGFWDLGVNKRRVEAIRSKLKERMK